MMPRPPGLHPARILRAVSCWSDAVLSLPSLGRLDERLRGVSQGVTHRNGISGADAEIDVALVGPVGGEERSTTGSDVAVTLCPPQNPPSDFVGVLEEPELCRRESGSSRCWSSRPIASELRRRRAAQSIRSRAALSVASIAFPCGVRDRRASRPGSRHSAVLACVMPAAGVDPGEIRPRRMALSIPVWSQDLAATAFPRSPMGGSCIQGENSCQQELSSSVELGCSARENHNIQGAGRRPGRNASRQSSSYRRASLITSAALGGDRVLLRLFGLDSAAILEARDEIRDRRSGGEGPRRGVARSAPLLRRAGRL